MTKKQKYFPIYIASVVLILMVVALVLLLTTGKKDEKFVPKKPKDGKTNISVLSSGFDSLRNTSSKEVDNKYYLIDDYFKNGFDLGTAFSTLIGDNIFLTNGSPLEKPYVSAITTKGKELFTTSLENKDYKTLSIYGVGEYENGYGIIALGEKKSSNDLLLITISKDGKITNTNKLLENFDETFGGLYFDKDKIIFITQNDDVIIRVIKNKKVDKTYLMDDDENDLFLYSTPSIIETYYNSGIAYVIVNGQDPYGKDSLNGINFLYKINIDTLKSELVKLKNIDAIQDYDKMLMKDDMIHITDSDSVKLFDLNGNQLTTVNYANLELENDDDYKEYLDLPDKEKENYQNYLKIDSLVRNNKKSTIELSTAFSNVYDELGKTGIENRYIINRIINTYYGSLLDTFIKDKKVYDIYFYGYDEPAILINVIG